MIALRGVAVSSGSACTCRRGEAFACPTRPWPRRGPGAILGPVQLRPLYDDRRDRPCRMGAGRNRARLTEALAMTTSTAQPEQCRDPAESHRGHQERNALGVPRGTRLSVASRLLGRQGLHPVATVGLGGHRRPVPRTHASVACSSWAMTRSSNLLWSSSTSENRWNEIRLAGVRQKLPIKTKITVPCIDQTFWVSVIGRGYIPPTRQLPLVHRPDEDPADHALAQVRLRVHGPMVHGAPRRHPPRRVPESSAGDGQA